MAAKKSSSAGSSTPLRRAAVTRATRQRQALSAKSNATAVASEVLPASGNERSASRKPARNLTATINISARTATVAQTLGSRSNLARLLEVSPSQPTQWINGAERPNLNNARAIVDLDYVIARAGLVWAPPVIGAWLAGNNAFLDGARPIDVVKTQGSRPVIDALDAELSGAFA